MVTTDIAGAGARSGSGSRSESRWKFLALSIALACAHPAAPPSRFPSATPLSPGDVEGLVVDPAGAPAAEAIVALVRPGAERPEAITRTDGEGRFRFYERQPGELALTATSPDGVAAFLPPQPLVPGASRAGLRLALGQGGYAIRGVVKDRAGRPFPLARVYAARIGPGRGDLFATIADAQGRYALRLTAATHLLFAEGDGHGSRSPARAAPGGPEVVDLVLDPAPR